MNIPKPLKTLYFKILRHIEDFLFVGTDDRSFILFFGAIVIFTIVFLLVVLGVIFDPNKPPYEVRQANYIMNQYEAFENKCLSLEHTKEECLLIWSGKND